LAIRLEERGAAVAAEQPVWAAQLGDVPADSTRRDEWVKLAAEVDVFRDRYKVDPAEAQAIPVAYRERAVGADLAARVTALHKSQALSTRPTASNDDRQHAAAEATAAAQKARDVATARTMNPVASQTPTPRTALDVMREANRAKAQAQQDAQRKAGLNVTGRQNTRDDQATTQPRDSRTRDDDRER
jgi:hypothetical protein